MGAGVSWSRDCFFTQGNLGTLYEDEIAGATDDVPYQTHRWFFPGGRFRPGYRIPLPPGLYRITLHSVETWPPYARQGERVFDVVIEGTKVLEDYDIFDEVGFATAKVQPFVATVKDGMLDILFLKRQQSQPACISAIEVQRLE